MSQTVNTALRAADTYTPEIMVVESVRDETADIRSLRLRFADAAAAGRVAWKAGQFGLFTAFGEGECTFCIANPPTRAGGVEFSFKSAGRVTRALRDLDVGDEMGFRGPYGNWFPIDDVFRGKRVVFIGGGIGLAPVRCVWQECLDRRAEFGAVTIVAGARTVADLPYKDELAEIAAGGQATVVTTVDPGGQTPEWSGKVGLVPQVLKELRPPAEGAVAVVCGPPIMIKFTLPVLEELGFPAESVYTTLENRMKCGVGKCGRCNVGRLYVCKDGPVFTAAHLRKLPNDF
jgi:sulfhydrogenase subunit gamma (sulfur reductase)